MKKVIFHIGLHKTGSSAIQEFLKRNARALWEQGYHYQPSIPAWPNHNPLAMAFEYGRDRETARHYLEDLKKGAKDRVLLISAEMLVEGRVDVRYFLDEFQGWEKTAIAYLRHPCDLVVAAYCELVKHYPSQHTREINAFPLPYDPGQTDPLQRYMEYEDLTLRLAPYDHRQWIGGSLFADFLGMVGARPAGMDMTDLRINPSLTYAAAEQIRRAIIEGANEEAHSRMVEELLRTRPPDHQYPLTADTIEYCLDRMRASLPLLRPFMRPGFDETFLLEPRNRK